VQLVQRRQISLGRGHDDVRMRPHH
jgi:hypothetical protein